MTNKQYVITGAAGFIGYHVAHALLKAGHGVVGVDCLTPYYDINVKKNRLAQLSLFDNFQFVDQNIAIPQKLTEMVGECQPDRIIHLAAQAGIAYSSIAPGAYMEANMQGFFEVLEAARHHEVPLLYASSSSVYGGDSQSPFSEDQPCNAPRSLYAATKKSNEMMAQSYTHLFNFKAIGLRFFTVYGPWGRPDMLLYKLMDSLYQHHEFTLYHHGKMARDFTYIDDVVAVILGLCEHWPSTSPHAILNIGHDQPVRVKDLITLVEQITQKTLQCRHADMRAEEVLETHADIRRLSAWGLPRPRLSMHVGVPRFIRWYQDYHQV